MSLNLVLDLDQGTSKLLDSVWHCLVGFDGPVHNFPENLHNWRQCLHHPGTAFILASGGQTLLCTKRIPGLAPAWSLTLDMWISSWYQTCRSVSLFPMWTCCHHRALVWDLPVSVVSEKNQSWGLRGEHWSVAATCKTIPIWELSSCCFSIVATFMAPKQVKLVDHSLCFQESLKLNWLFYSEIIKCSPNFLSSVFW